MHLRLPCLPISGKLHRNWFRGEQMSESGSKVSGGFEVSSVELESDGSHHTPSCHETNDAARYAGDQTALEVAALAQNWSIVLVLVKAKADVNVVFAGK